MSTKVSRSNTVYGYPNPQLSAFPDPIVAQRAPTTSDKAVVGQIWVDQVAEVSYIFIKNSAGNSVWVTQSNNGGAAVFASLSVVGNSTFTGNIVQSAGDVTIGNDAAGQTILIGTGAAVKSVSIGSTNTTSGTSISGGTNGITLNGNPVTVIMPGTFRIVPPVVTPNDTITNATANAYSGTIRFNHGGGWIAAAGALLNAGAPFVITNSALTANSAVLVTIQTENGTAANCMFRVAQVRNLGGSMEIYVVNDATAAAPSDCTLCIVNFIVMTP